MVKTNIGISMDENLKEKAVELAKADYQNLSAWINRLIGKEIERQELTAEEWLEGLNQIDFGKVPLTLGGGEPTKHHEFYDILDGLNPKINVDLLTNLQFDIDKFIKRASPNRFTTKTNHPEYKAIRVSYHPTRHNAKQLTTNVKKLQDAGFNIGIFGLQHPDYISDNTRVEEITRKQGVFFIPKDFMGEIDGHMYGHYKYPKGLDGIEKRALCSTKEVLISPEGDIYRCHRDLYAGEEPIGNITEDFKFTGTKYRPCNHYGNCNPCDVKLKTNLFLGKTDCQVDIVEHIFENGDTI